MRIKSGLYLIFLLAMLVACKEDDPGTNPYDTSGGGSVTQNDTVDPNSILGLHKNIFAPRCANPGCHDGTFEPDFRTVQSSYSSLVYMSVNKKTLDSLKYFTMRVIPGDVNNSFLVERLVTTTSDYMPSNSVRLSSSDIQHVRNWIQAGAKDQNGAIPIKPNLPPNVIGYIAVTTSFTRIDTIRYNGISYNPFVAPANSLFYIPFLALDTADGSMATDPENFTVSRIKISTLQDDFSNALTVNAIWMSPIPYTAWQVPVSTTSYTPGTTLYFRIYLNDGFQPVNVEFPRNASPFYYKSYYAFIVQ